MNMKGNGNGSAGYPVWMVWALLAAGAMAMLTSGALLNMGWLSAEGTPAALRSAALLVGASCLALGAMAIAAPYARTVGLPGRRSP